MHHGDLSAVAIANCFTPADCSESRTVNVWARTCRRFDMPAIRTPLGNIGPFSLPSRFIMTSGFADDLGQTGHALIRCVRYWNRLELQRRLNSSRRRVVPYALAEFQPLAVAGRQSSSCLQSGRCRLPTAAGDRPGWRWRFHQCRSPSEPRATAFLIGRAVPLPSWPQRPPSVAVLDGRRHHGLVRNQGGLLVGCTPCGDSHGVGQPVCERLLAAPESSPPASVIGSLGLRQPSRVEDGHGRSSSPSWSPRRRLASWSTAILAGIRRGLLRGRERPPAVRPCPRHQLLRSLLRSQLRTAAVQVISPFRWGIRQPHTGPVGVCIAVLDDPPPHAASPTDKATTAASAVSLFPD